MGPSSAQHHLIQWSAPLSWSKWVQQSGARIWAGRSGIRLELDIHRLEFDHHWLFSAAEARERALCRAYEAFIEVHERALHAVHQWLELRQAREEADVERTESEAENER